MKLILKFIEDRFYDLAIAALSFKLTARRSYRLMERWHSKRPEFFGL
jgi:hypothetical protein